MSVPVNFVNYVNDFYGANGIYPLDVSFEAIEAACGEYYNDLAPSFEADSIDRENVRDLIISEYGGIFPEKA